MAVCMYVPLQAIVICYRYAYVLLLLLCCRLLQDDAELQIAKAKEAALQQIADAAAEAADEAAAAASEAAERESVVAAALEEARSAVLAAQAEAEREREKFFGQVSRLQERARQLEHENKVGTWAGVSRGGKFVSS